MDAVTVGTANINATLKQRNLVDIYWALALFNMSNKHNGYSADDCRINEIEAPVLSFWSEKDIIIPEATVRETVEALGDKAELIIIKDSGHSPLVDCKRQFKDTSSRNPLACIGQVPCIAAS